MSTWPDDDRLVPTEDAPQDGLPAEDPELADEEVRAERPLELDEDDLRGDGPPEDLEI